MNRKLTFVRSPRWTWRNDVLYYFYHLPYQLINVILCYLRLQLRSQPTEFTLREELDIACGVADMRAGRWYKGVWVDE